MQAGRGFLVVAVLSCLIGLISAGPYPINPPSGEFWETAIRIYSSWTDFMSFKETADAIEEIVEGMKALPADRRQPTFSVAYDEYLDLLRFNKGECEQCGTVRREIENMIGKVFDFENGLGRANLLPYLKVCRSFQMSYCVSCTQIGKPEDIKTEATRYPGLLGGEMPHVDHKCDANCFAKELNLPKFENTKQVKELFRLPTFRKALKAIYSSKEQVFHVYYAPALRLALAELVKIENHDGGLDCQSLKTLKYQISSLLNVCTPEPAKCKTVFKEFTELMKSLEINDYETLKSRDSMRQYTVECLEDMKYYCSYFEYPNTDRFPEYQEQY